MISAVVLSHNDEQTIGRTLESLAWCDEIVVVDDESTDGTREVAKKHRAIIVRRALNGDFAGQRNVGLAKAKGSWVLFVDSDEVVTPELQKEIRMVTSDSGNLGYYIKRRDWIWGRELKYGETANIKLLRLAKKNAGTWERPVHEVWSPYAKATGDKHIQFGELMHPLDHYPHPNVAQFLKEVNYYSTLRAKELFDQEIRVYWWQIVAYPKAKFFLNYFWRLGFLDGTPGVIAALMMSFHSFLTRAKLWLLWHPPRQK